VSWAHDLVSWAHDLVSWAHDLVSGFGNRAHEKKGRKKSVTVSK